MKIALVILNWNGKHLLEQFLPSITSYSQEADIYVADNASSDDSLSFLQQHYPEVKIVKNKENFGFSKGYNEALQHIEADVYGLINSDVEVTPNWLTPIIKEFSENTSTAIVQPKLLDYKNKEYFEYAGAAGGFIDRFGYPFCRGRVFHNIEKDTHQFQSSEIFWASGASFFIREEVFNDLNGFDEDLFAHYEEIDLSWRAKNKGYLVKSILESEVYHVGGATLKEGSSLKTFLNFRNSLLSLVKNLPAQKIIPIIFTRLILDGVAGIYFLCLGKTTHSFAIIKAHFSFYMNFYKFYKKRSTKQISNYYKAKGIVEAYFMKGLKTFKEVVL